MKKEREKNTYPIPYVLERNSTIRDDIEHNNFPPHSARNSSQK